MKWNKKGVIFKPNKDFNWSKAYAWVPTVKNIGGDLFRVYFASRNSDNMSQTGYFELNILKPNNILYITPEPIIKLGNLGSFDDSLAVGCSLVTYKGTEYFYYVGWMQGKRVRYYPSIGLTLSSDNGKTFQKFSKAPILERIDEDAYGMASPFVMLDGNYWRMWYASYRRWELRNNEPWPHYEIRYAESNDGIHWCRKNIVCIGSEEDEAVARPYIIKENKIYKMWYSYRPLFSTYRIGYAESKDGISWKRMDNEVGIDVSDSGWDSQMIEYPCIFDHKTIRYMVYNGNNYGESGIGYAIAEKES